MKTIGSAYLSPDQRYRYSLWRMWEGYLGHGFLTFVMLNPSTADATQDDPTIRRCMGFARREGYPGIRVLNLFAYRSTDPKELLAVGYDAAVGGPEADEEIEVACMAGTVVAAWGRQCGQLGKWVRERSKKVACAKLLCLGLTADRSPRHPLYLPSEAPLKPWGLQP